jgi:hypothetical protein
VKKVGRRKNMLMPVWKSRHISVEVKRIVMLTCVRPIVEYGDEVWAPSTKQKWAAIGCVQTDIIKCAMRVGHERPYTHAVLAEWGVKPNAYVDACTCYGVFLSCEAYARVLPA